MDKKMSLKDVEHCINPKKECSDCKYGKRRGSCRNEALIIAAKIVEEKIKEKEHEMIDKAIDKIGISRDFIDIDQCYYPVRKMDNDGKSVCEFKEDAVCIMLNSVNVIGLPIALLVFGVEEEESGRCSKVEEELE